MLHQQRRPDGVDGKGLRHRYGVELLPSLFGLESLAMQQAGGVAHRRVRAREHLSRITDRTLLGPDACLARA
jgi:hypothetical protein